MTKASDLFVRCLENEGVKYIFGIPGEENLDFVESLRTSKIQLIVTRHEQAAGFMAATYGRLTRKAGVCLSTLGPGATNLVTPAAYAQLGGMPMVMITGQKPVKKSKQGLFQIINVVEMMRPLTKFTKTIIIGNNIPVRVREAFRLAQEERPGATHIEFPEDVATEDCSTEPIEVHRVKRARSAQEAIDAAADMIKVAKMPLLCIGGSPSWHKTGEDIAKFVDKTGIYFFDTQMGKGVVDERHPLFLGTAALSSHDYLHYAIEKADLIINVGHDVIEKPPFFMEPGGTKVIHINYYTANVDEVYFPQHEVVGDIETTMKRLTEKFDGSNNLDFSYFERVNKAVEKHVEEKSNDDRFPIIPQHLVAQVRKVLPDDGIIALDNGIYKIWFARNYKAYSRNTVLLDNALATMGAGLPSAMAAKMVHPDKKVIAICGDGGFMMNSQEMETAVRLKLDLVILLLNDGSFGMIRWKQAGMGLPDFGMTFGNPDFVKYAQSYGAFGHRLMSAGQLPKLLKECLDAKGVHLIDIPMDYSENEKVLIDELQSKTRIL